MDVKYDLIVAGGGLSGAAAALSAAREGLKVMLFDKNNCMGGAAVGNLVLPFMSYWMIDPETKEHIMLNNGIFAEILDNLKSFNAMSSPLHFHEEYLKLILNRLLLAENITLLYNSYLIDAAVESGTVKSITVANKSGKQTYHADYFIDATGDGDLAVLSGCPYHIGRESDNLCQPMTLCFRVINVDTEKFLEEKPAIQKLYKEYQAMGKIKNIREDVLAFITPIEGVIHFNSTRIVKKNPVDSIDATAAEIEAREQVFELFFFLKENFSSFKNSEILMTAMGIGVRESRMIEGEYLLTAEDLKACTKFKDSIATGNYDIDIHNPEGTGTSHYFFKEGEYYTIPYRCLTPKGIDNLLVTGRCISSTHEAQASYRIMPICCCLGQAAGIAIAIAKKSNCKTKEINIKELQDILVKNGAMV